MVFIGFILAAAIFFGIVAVYIIYIIKPSTKRKKYQRINRLIIESKWTEIEKMMKLGGPTNFRQAVIEGDKLIDLVLKSKVEGETMGERLKNSRHLFSHESYNSLWTAHKIRNKIVHEAQFESLFSDAKLAIKGYQKALKELGF